MDTHTGVYTRICARGALRDKSAVLRRRRWRAGAFHLNEFFSTNFPRTSGASRSEIAATTTGTTTARNFESDYGIARRGAARRDRAISRAILDDPRVLTYRKRTIPKVRKRRGRRARSAVAHRRKLIYLVHTEYQSLYKPLSLSLSFSPSLSVFLSLSFSLSLSLSLSLLVAEEGKDRRPRGTYLG